MPLRGIDTTQSAHFDTEDRATLVGDATYTYTPDGYLALKHSQEGTTTYAYTAFGELAQATLPDGRSITYTYDASRRRTSKAIDGAVTERYLWADTTRLLATYDAEGALLVRFLYADARTPFGADTHAGRIFCAYDQTGSLRTVTAEDGSLLKSVTHDSFGNLIADSAPDLAVPLGFAGGLHDADTGLTLFGARDYDAELGRWIAKDPIGFAGGDANLYGYCLGDPVNLVDPSGLLSQCWRSYENWMSIAAIASMTAAAASLVAWAAAGTVIGGLGAGAVAISAGAIAAAAFIWAAVLKQRCLAEDARLAACLSTDEQSARGRLSSGVQDGTSAGLSVGFVAVDVVAAPGLLSPAWSFVSTISAVQSLAEVGRMRAAERIGEQQQGDDLWVGGGGQ